MGRAAALLVFSGLLGCALAPRVRTDSEHEAFLRGRTRALARENRSLRRENRALERDLDAARQAAQTEAEARSSDHQAQTQTTNALADQIGALAATIERLQNLLRMELPPAALRARAGEFSKIQVGDVPARSPTPPHPRAAMSRAPEEPEPVVDVFDPFSKAAHVEPSRPPPAGGRQ